MFILDVGLSEDKSVVGMDCSIGNPILLWSNGRTVDNKFFSLLVIVSSSLHLDCVIAVSELSQAKAASYFKTVNLIENPFVSVSMKSNYRSA